MSFYTKFQDVEVTVTSSTTSILQSTDPVLVFSNQQKRAAQAQVGAISSIGTVTQITTLTTGTVIPPFGLSVINTTSGTANNVTWTLADPTVTGLCKTLYCISTSTTTPVTLQVLFNTATGISTDVASGSIVSVGFGTAAGGSGYGGYFELQAQSTSSWLVVGRSAGQVHSS